MSEQTQYLPLGSIVHVSGGIRKYLIVARGLQVKVNGEDKFFDYGACVYPEGMAGDRLMYFQHANISSVVFQGFSDEDNELMVKNIQEAVKSRNIRHADVKQIKQHMGN